MDRELARDVIRAAYRSGAELEKLVVTLKERASPEDYKDFMRQVAIAIDGIHVALVHKVLVRYPELDAEMQSNLARTGRVMP